MILDHRGKNLLFLRLGLELCSFGFAIGCLISLQFKTLDGTNVAKADLLRVAFGISSEE